MKFLINFLIAIGLIFVGEEAYAAFKVQEFTTAKGIRVRYLTDPTTPVISMVFSFECGAVRDPKGLEGTATFLASMMTEGTKTKSVEQLSEIMQDLSIVVGHDATDEYFQGKLITLRENKDKAFALMKETLFESDFKEAALERARDELLTLLALKEHDPMYQVSLNINKSIFKDHPYARPTMGTPESIKKIKQEDLKKFAEQFSKKSLLVVLSGNISQEEIEKHVDDTFGHLPTEVKLNDLPQVDLTFTNTQKVIKQKIPQTAMGFVQRGLKYNDDKFLQLVVLNWIVSEKLRLIVREEKGLAYQIGTSPSSNKQLGLFLGFCGTKNEAAHNALKSILKVVKDIKDKGVTEQEFQDAKSNLMGSYVLNFQDTPGIANSLLGLMQIERPANYIDIRNELMRKISKQEIDSLAKDMLDPDHTTFVLYGNPDGVS